jgi:hypothetical protein
MPLMISEIKDRFCPIVVCDHCLQMIQDARDGNYQWAIDEQTGQPLTGEIFFTHKRCFPAFDAKSRTALGREIVWGAMGLEGLPIYLVHNLRLGREAMERADFLDQM